MAEACVTVRKGGKEQSVTFHYTTARWQTVPTTAAVSWAPVFVIPAGKDLLAVQVTHIIIIH